MRKDFARVALAVFFLALGMTAAAQSRPRIVAPVDLASRAILPNSHLRILSQAKDLGPLNGGQNLDRMVLVLKIAAEQQHQLTALVDSQQTKGSQSYHAWLTPEEFGQRFGPAPADLAKIGGWLQQQGFRVDATAKSGLWIEFSGTVAQVNTAFHTQMHRYQIDGENHIANATDISVPLALAPVVQGMPLHDFFSKPTLVYRQGQNGQAGPEITAPWSGAHAIVPGDFATIYDLNPLYKAGLNGSGQTIALVEASDINLSDVAAFQKIFGLPSNVPNVIEDGADPGVDTQQGYGAEATLDTEWASAVAPGAAIDLVVTGPDTITDPAALSAAYIIDQNLAQIVSVSFAQCEQNLGTGGNALWNNLWEQAAAQGMSVFVSSGDAGSVTCNSAGIGINGYGPMAVNGIASTPFDTAVGGTEFAEGANGGSAATFWNSTNAANFASVTGYIPEMVWNDSCDDVNAPYGGEICSSTLPTLAATGGGVSTVYATPSWQTLNVTGLQALASYSLPNQPGVSPRGVPDVALPASADHDGYLFCFTANPATPDCQLANGELTETTFQNEAGGTSFATPAFAGIMAIVDQKLKNAAPSPSPVADGRQGLANYALYSLASSETFSGCNSTNRTNPSQAAPAGCIFNDITTGSNAPSATYSAPGVTGYSATTGYDLVSGLGSVDANNLVTSWANASADFQGTQTTLTTGAGTSAIAVGHGQPVTFNVSVQKLSGSATTQPRGSISLLAQGGSLAGSVGVANALLAGSTNPVTTGNFPVSTLPGGAYNLVADFPGDGTFAGSVSNPIAVTVTPESSVTTLQVGTYSEGYGTPVEFLVQVAGASGQGYPSGQVTLADKGTVFAQLPLSSEGAATFNTCAPLGGGFFPPFATLPCFGVGTHQFTATYSGDTSFSPSLTPPAASQQQTVQIPKGDIQFSNIAFNSQTNTGEAVVNAPRTLTAGLPTSPEAAVPTGTVQFLLGATALGPPVPVTGNPAQASMQNVVFPQGKNLVTANYSGDSNYNSTSLVENFVLGVPVGWLATATSATINPGQTATYNLTLSGFDFTGQAVLTCSAGTNLAQPATPPAGVQCSVSPASVNLTSASETAPVVVTITTTSQSRLSTAPFGTLPFTLPPVLAFMLWGTGKKRWRSLMGCIAVALAVSVITSCGGGSNPASTVSTGPPATSAVFTVWAGTSTTNAGVTTTAENGVILTTNITQ